jgi:hypothetical protein
VKRVYRKADFGPKCLHITQTEPSWQTVNNWIERGILEPGRLWGRERIWTDEEVSRAIERLPSDKAPLRGRAKTLVEGARPPENGKPGPSAGAGNTDEGTGPNQATQLAPSSIPDSAPAPQDLEEVVW